MSLVGDRGPHTNGGGYVSREDELCTIRYLTGLHTKVPQYKYTLRRDEERVEERKTKGYSQEHYLGR